MKHKLTNKFFDINKLPAEEGILVFPISMSKISNAQDAKHCLEHLEHFTAAKGNKIMKPLIGLNFVYSDYLYFHSDEKGSALRNKFFPLSVSHKNNFLKLLKRNPWYIEKAFSFLTWNQILLESRDFVTYFGNLKKIYRKDKKFQQYMLDDLKMQGKIKLDENQLNFFLEETLLFYLIAKGKIKLYNEFIQGHEKWILYCYPGPPLKSQIYLFQKNFFKFKNPKNKFENAYYDLSKNKLYEFDRVDLDTIEF